MRIRLILSQPVLLHFDNVASDQLEGSLSLTLLLLLLNEGCNLPLV